MNPTILQKKVLLLLIFLSTSLLSITAQISNYTFTQSNIPYSEITGGTIVVTTADAADDDIYLTNAIGFPFAFDGVAYTTFGINANGYIWFGAGEPTAATYAPISDASANHLGTGTISGVISPMGNDLLQRTLAPLGELRVETIGSAPNRTCVIQFANWRGYGLGTGAIYNFQIRLSETSNQINFNYGSFTGGATASSAFEVGLRGADNSDYTNVVADAVGWANAIAGSTNDAGSTISGSVFPATGTNFNFTPGALATCAKPNGLITKAITATSDSIIWNKVNGATNYQWAVTTSATPPASGTTTASNNDTAQLASGLLAGTQYYAHVRSFCGGVDYSIWSTKSFTTLKANDFCVDALDVTSNIGANIADTVGKANLVEAGLEGTLGAASCSDAFGGGFANDVWFKFNAPSNGDSVIITGAAGSSSDWVYQVYDACGGTAIACSDDGSTANPFGNTLMPYIGICGLTPGATYYVRTYPYSTSTTATCKLYIYSGGSCPTPPVNDNCISAINLSVCAAPIAGTTVNASASSVANTNCGSTFATQTDVWYKFNTGANIIVPYIKVSDIDTVGGKDVYLSLYHGNSCTNLLYDGCLARPNTTSNFIEAYLFGANANEDYYVRIYSTLNTRQTTFNISFCDSTSLLTVDTTGQSPTLSCLDLGSATINAANQNNNKWVRIINSGMLCEINANGQNLGATNFKVVRNISGTVRRDNSRPLPALGKEFMDRNITITPTTQPTGPVKVRMYFTTTELNDLIAAGGDGYSDVLAIGDLVITKNQQTCGDFVGGNSEVRIAQQANGSFADGGYVEFEVSSFSTFFLHGGATPLPVNLIGFTAQKRGSVNVITWQTAQELNTNRFVIERSNDGINFNAIGQINSTGNSTTAKNYSFIDNVPARGINYYRLKVIDNDNSNKTSTIKNVRNEGATDVTVYPNPVKNTMQLKVNSDKNDKALVTLIDLNGKTLLTTTFTVTNGTNILDVQTNTLKSGTYIIKIQLNDEIIIKKFNKL
jgi:Secretion system C-terminal sorting domain